MPQVYPPAEEIEDEIIDPPMLGTPYFGPSGVDVNHGRYASSFVAPHVNDFGQTISPASFDGYQSEELAIRARGNMEFNELVNGGATPEEALLRTAGKLFYNQPEKMAIAANRLRYDTPAPAWSPSVRTIDGVKMAMTSPRSAVTVRPTAAAKMPQANVDERQLLMSRLAADRAQLKQLQNVKWDEDPPDPATVKALQDQIAAAEGQFRNLGTNWMSDAPTQPIAPPPAETPKVSAESIRASFRAGKISRDEAKQQLKALGYD